MPEQEYTTFELLRRLYHHTRGFRLHLAVIVGLSLAATPLTLLNPVPLKIIVDSGIGGDPLPGYLAWLVPQSVTSSAPLILLSAALLFVLISVLSSLRGLLTWYVQSMTGERLVLAFRAKLFAHVQRLSLSFHDEHGSSESVYRIQYDATSIQQIYINGGINILTSVFPLFGMIVVTALIDWQLTLIALAALPLLLILVRFFGRRMRASWRIVRENDSSAMAVLQEVLGSLRVVTAFGRESSEKKRFLRESEERISSHLDAVRMSSTYSFLVGLTVALATAAVLYVGAVHVRSNILTIGELLMIMTYIGQILGPLRQLSRTAMNLSNGFSGAERAFRLLDEEEKVTSPADPRQIERRHGTLAFDNVSFSYRPGVTVLRNVSFKAEPGQRVGIQGPTGSGKSTIINLMLRLYDPDEGVITYDGRDIREFDLEQYRALFALVLQEPVLFSTSVEENIRYGKPEATREDVVRAAKLADADGFISRLPNGYQMEVGEKGYTLSGGERQRISLARAFLHDAPILVLDEPTSAVDLGTEANIMEAIERLMQDRTTFIVAHRLSTLEGCDTILEVDRGKVSVSTQVEPASAYREPT